MELSKHVNDNLAELKQQLYEEADKNLEALKVKLEELYKQCPHIMKLLEEHSCINYRHDGVHELNVALSAIPNDGYRSYIFNILTSGRPLKVIDHLLGHKEDMPLALNGLDGYCKKNKLAVPNRNDTVLVHLMILMLLEDRPLTVSFEDLHKHPSTVPLKCYNIPDHA